MKTGKFDKNNTEIQVGDIVHFRCKHFSLCGEGRVYLEQNNSDRLNEDPFRIIDTRERKSKGRIYPWYDDAVYTVKRRA